MYLINSRRILAMVKGWDHNGHGLDMIHTHIKLILQHSSPLVTHTCKGLFPLLGSLEAHVPEDPQRHHGPTKNPCNQELPPPSFWDSLGPKILVVMMVDLTTVPWDFFPPFEPHLDTITKQTRLGVQDSTIGKPVHGNYRHNPAT